MNWDRLCQPKLKGGMGFRDVTVFNLALLAKQSWHNVMNPESLMVRIFKAKYFPHGSFLEADVGNNPSCTWRSLLWGRDLPFVSVIILTKKSHELRMKILKVFVKITQKY